jgi:hypothetical protein
MGGTPMPAQQEIANEVHTDKPNANGAERNALLGKPGDQQN